MTGVSDAEYWNQLYQANEAGWDKGRCAPPIARMFSQGVLPAGAHVAVVGCGPGHEAFEAAKHALIVTAVDFSEEAIDRVRHSAHTNQLIVEAVRADVFELARRWPRQFDAVLEHTCLCAIDPARRDEYIRAIAGSLKLNGLYFGLLYAHDRPGGPPFAITEQEARQLLIPHFKIERMIVPRDSFENRQGHELEFIARCHTGSNAVERTE